MNASPEQFEKWRQEIVRKMFNLCRIGIAINMVTDYVDYKEDYLYYYSPEETLKFCKTLSKWVALRHDYPLHEFTVYVYKNSTSIYKPNLRRKNEEEQEEP